MVISLDGCREDQELNRRPIHDGDGSFDFWPHYHHSLLSLPGFRWVNMVIAPNTAANVFENFSFLVREGLRSFNFLPAYYQPWEASQLQDLEHGLSRVASFLERALRNGNTFFIRNLDVNLPHPLYRAGRTVDTDGEVFDSDIIVAEPFMSHRKRFSLGNVLNAHSPDDFFDTPEWSWTTLTRH